MIYDDELPVSRDDWDAYWNVLSHACGVHMDRESIRHGLWKKYPSEDQVKQIKIKVERVQHTLDARSRTNPLTPEGRSNMKEELLDIINYAVFAHRIIDGRV